MHPPLDLAEVDRSVLTSSVKGVPAAAAPLALADIGARHWNLLREDLPWPVAVLKDSALRNNSAWMMQFASRRGVALCPHGKTTMSPQLFDRQLRDGAWGMTAATAGHVMTYRRFGVRRILMANQLVGRRNVEAVLGELAAHAEFDYFCLVDSVAGVDALARAVRDRSLNRPLQVLLEVGMAGGRTGTRSMAEALRVAAAVRESRGALALRGVEFFEGISSINADGEPVAQVSALLDLAAGVVRALVDRNDFAEGEILVSGGGSAYFDLVAACLTHIGAARLKPILRSGCYLTHDSALYERHAEEIRARDPGVRSMATKPQAALEIWGVVQSLPEPGLAIVGFGKRDVSYDAQLPVPKWTFHPGSAGAPRALDERFRIRALNDQHAYLVIPPDHSLEYGDLVGVGISHPCTTFDKWQLLYLVDDAYEVLGGIRTFF